MKDSSQNKTPKLFMVLLGSKAPARNVEQHDYFFGIAESIEELVPAMKTFWPEAGSSLHMDGWREVTHVNGYDVKVVPKQQPADTALQLFFINLGGYTSGLLAEQHYTVLTVQTDKAAAVQEAKRTVFFKQATIKGMKGANSHIDEKYGVDVDDIYRIEDILSDEFKSAYNLLITPAQTMKEDDVTLGYFRLDKFGMY